MCVSAERTTHSIIQSNLLEGPHFNKFKKSNVSMTCPKYYKNKYRIKLSFFLTDHRSWVFLSNYSLKIYCSYYIISCTTNVISSCEEKNIFI